MFSSKKKSTPASADLDLAGRCLRGDLGAFEELYRQQGPRIYSLAYRMTGGSASDAEELVQETFLLAFRKLDSFKGESALGTWLYRLASNLCVDHLRSRHARMAQVSEPIENEAGELKPFASGPPAEMVLTAIDLERAVAKLPVSYRSAFVLHDVEGYEHKEVGAMLGIAEGTSKSLVFKARRRLRTLLSGAPVRA